MKVLKHIILIGIFGFGFLLIALGVLELLVRSKDLSLGKNYLFYGAIFVGISIFLFKYLTGNKFKFKSIYGGLTIFLVLVTSVLIFMLKRAKIEDNNFIIGSIKGEISIETRNDCLANIEDIINADKICWCYSKKIVQRLEPNEKIKSSSEKLNHRKSIKEIDNEFFKSTYKELLDECIESYRG